MWVMMMRRADKDNSLDRLEARRKGYAVAISVRPLCSRAEAVEFGMSANEAEGLAVSPFFKMLAGEYVRGEIDLREFHDRLDLHYYGRRGVSNALSGCRY